MSVTLRGVTGDDWELWRAARLRALSADPDAFGSTLDLERSYDEPAWRARLARGRMVLATLDARPVAIGGVYDETPDVCWVVSMWTAPEVRGRGVGTALLTDVLHHAVASGRQVRLWVADGNPARRIYERAGFVATGRREPIRPGAATQKAELVLVRAARYLADLGDLSRG